MREQWRLWLFCFATMLPLLSISACTAQEMGSTVHQTKPAAPYTASNIDTFTMNATSFSFSGKTPASYTIHTTTQLSKLRHGHQEFTINIANADTSLIIAFIGYTGPATYTLSNHINGGDVRIALGQQYWDLSLTPNASCSLSVLSDNPTEQADLHRMQGKFSCPTLPPGYFNKPSQPVAIPDGTFNVLMLVES
jgi:hypothetical protein